MDATLALSGGGGLAIGAMMEGAGAAIATTLASIPVAGWIALAVLAVAVICYVFWDDICDFFSSIWSWFTQQATIVYEWTTTTAIPTVDTAENIWSQTATVDQGRIDQARQKAADLLAEAALVTTLAFLDNVYEIIVLKDGRYRDYTFRKGYLMVHITKEIPSRTYKYGTTSKAIAGRYVSTSYVGNNFSLGNFGIFWHYLNVNTLFARAQETLLIADYCEKWGYFPPGNTKFG